MYLFSSVLGENMARKLDKTERKLIAELSKDGRAGLVDLGKKLGLSHTTVGNRMKSLVKKGIMKISPVLNIKELGMQIAVLGVELDGLDSAMKFAKKFQDCPRVVFLAPMTGDFNLVMIVVSEDFKCLQNVIEKTLRVQPGVKRLSLSFTSTLLEPSFLHLKIPVATSETSPCNKKCRECESYLNELCVGCPSVGEYRGCL